MKSIILKLINKKITPGQVFNNLKYRYCPERCRLFYDPIELSVQVTNRCTFACDMCQTHSVKIPRCKYHYQGGRDIDFTTFKRFVDIFKNAVSASLIGTGEPLLNKDLFAMINYAAKEKKMHVSSVSNGTILGDKIDDVLKSSLNALEISLNGHSSEEFHRMTGQPEKCYSVVCNNIEALIKERNKRQSKLRISLSFILDRQNYKNIFKMAEIAKKLGADAATFHNFLPSPVSGFTAEERCLYADDKEAEEILTQLKKTDYGIVINFPILLDKTRKKKYCKDYFRVIRVDGEGNIGGCSGQLLNLEGNGKFYDKDVWNNAHFRERRKIFIDPNLPELDPCRTCSCNNKP